MGESTTANTITNDTTRDLARANGLAIPDERLEAVRKDYEGFLLLIGRLDTFPLKATTVPAISFLPLRASASFMDAGIRRRWRYSSANHHVCN